MSRKPILEGNNVDDNFLIGVVVGAFLFIAVFVLLSIAVSYEKNQEPEPSSSFNPEAFVEDLARGPWECVETPVEAFVKCVEGKVGHSDPRLDENFIGFTDDERTAMSACKAKLDIRGDCILYSNGHIDATPEQLKTWGIPAGEVI